jgi:hypothetical protein
LAAGADLVVVGVAGAVTCCFGGGVLPIFIRIASERLSLSLSLAYNNTGVDSLLFGSAFLLKTNL